MEINKRFLDNITEFIFIEQESSQADIIFIPGDGYPQMAEKAAELFRRGYAPRVLPSGNYSILQGEFPGVKDKAEQYAGKYSSEWEFLRYVLIHNGVPKDAILKEDRAAYTYENAIYSRETTDREGLIISRAILCCKSFHARRSLMYYQLLYPETEFLVCGVDIDGISRDTWYKSKKGIETVLGEVERCGGQFHEILNAMRTDILNRVGG